MVSHFSYIGGSHSPDWMTKGGELYRFVKDQVGSVRLVVNALTGDIAQELEYDEFGVVTTDTNPGFQPFGFAGGLYDVHTGLTRFGARDYDASVGRWTSKDPIGFRSLQENLYIYVSGDPVNLFDSNGHQAIGPTLYHLVQWLIDRDRNRNLNNRCPPRVPTECPSGRDWTQSHPWSNAWRAEDGSECIYDANGDLVTDPLWEGSWDYGPPDDNMTQHLTDDVFPWMIWGP